MHYTYTKQTALKLISAWKTTYANNLSLAMNATSSRFVDRIPMWAELLNYYDTALQEAKEIEDINWDWFVERVKYDADNIRNKNFEQLKQKYETDN